MFNVDCLWPGLPGGQWKRASSRSLKLSASFRRPNPAGVYVYGRRETFGRRIRFFFSWLVQAKYQTEVPLLPNGVSGGFGQTATRTAPLRNSSLNRDTVLQQLKFSGANQKSE